MANLDNKNINNQPINSDDPARMPNPVIAPQSVPPQPPQVPQQSGQSQRSVVDFSQDTSATRLNFPSAAQFQQLCAKNNFNRVLDMVKSKMFAANGCFQSFARVTNADTTPFPATIVKDVKDFLVSQGYTITEIEDGVGVSQGWKLSW